MPITRSFAALQPVGKLNRECYTVVVGSDFLKGDHNGSEFSVLQYQPTVTV